MTTKAYVAVALALWMTLGAFLALPATASPNHVVAGGVLPVTAGPGNPANAATFAFYSTNQPGYAVLMGADSFVAADGTDPAFFFKDVGASWNWAAGDTAVAVVETVRGTNGWTNFNYTTSLDATLQLNPTTTDMGNGTLERFPVVTLSSGTGYVVATWTALTDAQGNVRSYHEWTSTAPGGPWTSVTNVTHAAGPRSYNNTGLVGGQHCYVLGVNYRGNTAMSNGTYETMGRSEPVCTTIIGQAPTILSTDPASNTPNVAVIVDIVVTFDQPIDAGSLVYTISPTLTNLTSWGNGGRTLTISHPTQDFNTCRQYTVNIIAARNPNGTNIVPGPVPNPWSFTTVCPNPYVFSTNPPDGRTGWPTTHSVVITFSKAMNTASVTAPFSPTVPGQTTAWNTPTNTVLTISGTLASFTWYNVTVSGTDTLGNALVVVSVPNPFTFRTNSKPIVAITAPVVANECLTGGSTLTVIWTMSDFETTTANLHAWANYSTDGGSTWNAISGAQDLTGQSSPVTVTWTTSLPSGTDVNATVQVTVLDTAPDATPVTSVGVRIDSTTPTVSTTPADNAVDVEPGSAVIITFSEAMDRTAAQAAIGFTPAVGGLAFTWSADDKTVTVTHDAFAASTDYTLTIGVGAKDACSPGLALASAKTVAFKTKSQVSPGADYTWLIILIIVIAIVLILAFVLMRRRPAAAPPAGEEAAPPAGGPAEEEMAGQAPPEAGGATPGAGKEEAGGESFIPCPNCGTMVKPTDAECFVCGAKL